MHLILRALNSELQNKLAISRITDKFPVKAAIHYLKMNHAKIETISIVVALVCQWDCEIRASISPTLLRIVKQYLLSKLSTKTTAY